MQRKDNLRAARAAKNDEFYTQREDIEKELAYYEAQLRDQIVYCPCDDYRTSQFVAFFRDNFHRLGLKKLIATHYTYQDLFTHNTSYKYEFDGRKETITALEGDGDFRSDECMKLLDEADVVVTNPPFSLFREFITLVEKA